MANYPQLDNARGVWNMKEVYDAVMGGYWPNALSRGVFMSGRTPSANVTIDYVTLQTAGDAADFGDIITARHFGATQSSFTRAIHTKGYGTAASAYVNVAEYVTIMSAGNAADFGDATAADGYTAGCSNSVRGIIAGDSAVGDVIEYITMASLGNYTDFGNLTSGRDYMS